MEWKSRPILDVNQATVEQIRAAFNIDEEAAKRIIANRPYSNWTEFSRRNPQYSPPNLEALKQDGVFIGAIGLNRLKL